jgi:hypothetical protein
MEVKEYFSNIFSQEYYQNFQLNQFGTKARNLKLIYCMEANKIGLIKKEHKK